MTNRTPYPNLTEEAFAAWAESQGWIVTKRGWPDFFCRRDGEIMAVEVKGGNDSLRPEQYSAIADLRLCGLPTFVWSPDTGLMEPTHKEVTESIGALQSRIKDLERQLLAALNGVTPPAEKATTLTFADDEQQGLRYVAAWCRRRHRGHESTLRGRTLAVCVWLVMFSRQHDVSESARLLGIPADEAKDLLGRALRYQTDKLARRRLGLVRPAA